MAFLLQENCATGLQTLPHTFLVSGLIVGVDMLLKVFLAVEVLVFPCLNFIFPISVCLCMHVHLWFLMTVKHLLKHYVLSSSERVQLVCTM